MSRRLDSAALSLLGRVLLGSIFLISGLSKIPNWAATHQMMVESGMTLVPFFLTAATILEIGAGLAVLLGWKARESAAILFLYLVPVTLIFHDFWSMGGGERTLQTIMFLKNLSIMGGLLGEVAHGPGAFSMDAWKERRSGSESEERPRLRRVS
ncbi:MAG: DoxX family protein [Oligoflexia bacterium]|nr:DoxX family protein [Oligoflexia bacterium]